MKEQRVRERRAFDAKQAFPFPEVTGRIILEDRRKMPDRRLNNIRLELVTLPLDELPADIQRPFPFQPVEHG